MDDIYYYVAYTSRGNAGGYGVSATHNQTPAEWSIEASDEFDDGPYIVLYSEVITKEQHDYINGYMA